MRSRTASRPRIVEAKSDRRRCAGEKTDVSSGVGVVVSFEAPLDLLPLVLLVVGFFWTIVCIVVGPIGRGGGNYCSICAYVQYGL